MRDKLLSELNSLLSLLTINEPIASLLNPVIEFLPGGGDTGIRMTIKMRMLDISGLNTIDLESNHHASQYQLERFIRKPIELMQFVRRSLIQRLEHEIDESLWYNGVQLNVPKHWGPTEPVED